MIPARMQSHTANHRNCFNFRAKCQSANVVNRLRCWSGKTMTTMICLICAIARGQSWKFVMTEQQMWDSQTASVCWSNLCPSFVAFVCYVIAPIHTTWQVDFYDFDAWMPTHILEEQIVKACDFYQLKEAVKAWQARTTRPSLTFWGSVWRTRCMKSYKGSKGSQISCFCPFRSSQTVVLDRSTRSWNGMTAWPRWVVKKVW